MLRRKHPHAARRAVEDRASSARTTKQGRDATTDLVRHAALPAVTGPLWAPDELSIWPVEGGRYGIDAHYHGVTGAQRAGGQLERLRAASLNACLRLDPDDGATLRLGPLAHEAAWLALQAFLGRPPDVLA